VDFATQGYVALVGLLILLFHNATVPAWPGLLLVHALMLGFVHFMIQRRAAHRGGAVLDFFRYFYPVPLFIFFYAEAGWLNRIFVSHYQDHVVIGWEQAVFGCQPGILLMSKFPYLWVSELLYAAYFSYYAMILGIGLALFRAREQFLHYLSVMCFVFYLCYLIFIAFPVVGPPGLYHHVAGMNVSETFTQVAAAHPYPEAIQRGPFYQLVTLIYRVFEMPGAAFPSSHVAVAVCAVYFSFLYLRRVWLLLLVVAILLCIATVYCRFHYGVDVLAGWATAAILIPLGNRLYFKSAVYRR
jgi:membrane-associated phospholipid phosphatase